MHVYSITEIIASMIKINKHDQVCAVVKAIDIVFVVADIMLWGSSWPLLLNLRLPAMTIATQPQRLPAMTIAIQPQRLPAMTIATQPQTASHVLPKQVL